MRRLSSLLIGLFFCAVALALGTGAQEAPRLEPPRVTHTVQAQHPINSIAFGTVMLEVTLDESGSVRDVRVLRDIPSLTEPAKEAVRKWRFEPARLNGKPVESRLPVAFSFSVPAWCGFTSP